MDIQKVLEESPQSIKGVPNDVKEPDYSKEEQERFGLLRYEIQQARILRDTMHDEFDGQSYVTWWEANEKSANTFIPPRLNKEDTNVVTGTTREKLMAILAAVYNLNLSPDIQAFDDHEIGRASCRERV